MATIVGFLKGSKIIIGSGLLGLLILSLFFVSSASSESAGPASSSKYGPQRNDPAQGIPKNAYSPFDERFKRPEPRRPASNEYQKGQVLIKVKPDSSLRMEAPELGVIPAEESPLDKALSDHGVVRMEAVFPTAVPPTPGETIPNRYGAPVPKPDLSRWYRAILKDEQADPYDLAQELSKTSGIEKAEPDYLRKPVGGPSGQADILRESSRSLMPDSNSDPLYSQQWHLAAAKIPEAWAYLESQGLPPGGNRDIIVAVIDTGVDYNHPDLAANMWTNSLETAGNGIDDDHNGYVDDVHGMDAITNSGNPLDDHGHGTHVAGIIAAQAGNGLGGVGVAYNVQIMSIKAAQYSGVLSTSDIAEAIYYAVANGADVINMSFGGYSRSQIEEDALAVAFGQAVLVAAAGNDGLPNECHLWIPQPNGSIICLSRFAPLYPAAYNWVLGVMASDQNNIRLRWSNWDVIPHNS